MVAPAPSDQRTWRQAVAIGIVRSSCPGCACSPAPAIRASQVTVDANDGRRPEPGRRRRGSIAGVFTQWDGLWYLEIVRSGYPRSIPPNITYFQLEARTAFFPLYPMLVRARSTGCCPAATRSPRWPSTSPSASPPCSSSACSPAGSTTTTSPSGRWCCSRCSPGSFVLSYAYAEALLIVLAAACLWFLLDERWLLAGVAAALGHGDPPQRRGPDRRLRGRRVHRHPPPS